MALRLTISAGDHHRVVPLVRRGILGAHRLIRSRVQELSIAIVPAGRMARLHKAYLHESGPTDVLTFELDRDSRRRVIAGEIVICSTVARERARRLGHSVASELLLYALHGLLHLSGFDDRTESAFAAMHAKEDEILTRLGFGPLFFPKAPKPSSARKASAGRRVLTASEGSISRQRSTARGA